MAFLVILPSRRGVRKGAAFVFGWLASLVVVVVVTVLATGNNPPKPDTAPSHSAGAGGEDRHWGLPDRDCDPAAPQERAAEEAEESAEVAGACGQHVPRGMRWAWRPFCSRGA